MEQLSFNFMQEIVSSEELMLEANQLAFEWDELLRKIIVISGEQALDMAVRGDFYDTEYEGCLLHSKLRRIAFMLDWK